MSTSINSGSTIFGFPWRSYEELEIFLKTLFKEHDPNESFDSYVERLIESKNTLMAWKLRGGTFEYFWEIQTTIDILTAIIHDRLVDAMETAGRENEGNFEASIHLESALHSLYGTAMISFYDLIKYYKRKPNGGIARFSKDNNLGNVGNHAESLGLPSWIADARNESAHGSQSSLSILKKACFIGLDFIRDNFWNLLLQNRIDIHTEIFVKDILNLYMNEADVSIPDKFASDRIGNFLHQHNSKFTTLKFMVNSLLRNTAWDEDLTTPDNSLVREIHPKHKQAGVMIIKQVVKLELLHSLCHEMISSFDEEGQMREAGVAWVIEILRGMTEKDAVLSKVLSDPSKGVVDSIRDQDEFKIYWVRILHHLARKPSKITLHLLSYFKAIIPFCTDTVTKLQKMMEVILGEGDEKNEKVIQKSMKRKRTIVFNGKAKRTDWSVKTAEDALNAIEHGINGN